MENKKKKIIKQDIADLEYLINMYSNEKQFFKASECLKEKEELKNKLREE
jgi:hypothetical protein